MCAVVDFPQFSWHLPVNWQQWRMTLEGEYHLRWPHKCTLSTLWVFRRGRYHIQVKIEANIYYKNYNFLRIILKKQKLVTIYMNTPNKSNVIQTYTKVDSWFLLFQDLKYYVHKKVLRFIIEINVSNFREEQPNSN